MSNDKVTNRTAEPAVSGIKRAAIYARVSTDEQAGDGHYSLSTQLEACRKYAEQNRLEVVGESADDFTGAVPIEQRPEGRNAYTMLANGEADVLIAYRIDRIVRPPEEGDEWDMPILIRGLAKLGKEIHTVNRGKLGTSFAELLIAMLDARKAGEERREIIERTNRGKRAKARAGKPVGVGNPPYGYKYSEGQFLTVKSEAKVIQNIYRWYAFGENRKGPMTGYAIAKRLSEMGVPTPAESRPNENRKRKRQTGIWNEETVHNILKNETYSGLWHYGKRIGQYGVGGARPKEEQIVVNVPTIVSRELWQAAQDQRKRNVKLSLRHATPRRYLLRGMAECNCGLALIGTLNNGYPYYGCNSKGRYFAGIEKPRCEQRPVRGELLEYVAWDFIFDAMTNVKDLKKKLKEAQRLEQEAKQPARDELALVLEYIKETESEIDEIALALRKAKGRVADSLERQQTDVNARHTRFCRRREELQAEIDARELTDGEIENTLQFQRDVAAGLRKPTWDDRRYYLEMLHFKVVVTGRKAKLSCRLRVGVKEVDLSKIDFIIL